MRLQLDLDTDPHGTGRRARWWALIFAWATIILAEIALIGLIAFAITHTTT